jgi:hypothetical protein
MTVSWIEIFVATLMFIAIGGGAAMWFVFVRRQD